MEKIIECVPNFSTSDPKVVSEIETIISETPNTFILNSESDIDHNRTVITFISDPNNITDVCFNMIDVAASLIDLSKHRGVHPRVGATDVCPLVPFQNVTARQCIELAKELAKTVADELGIPTHLYGQAAKSNLKRNLANIRNKRLEPDFGPDHNTRSGATCIGVRDILIAFNINLKTNNLKIAKAIVDEVRKLHKVKALAFSLKSKGIVQISMNLTNYKVTPPIVVFKKTKALAQKLGVEILESELIGFIPQEALNNTSDQELLITNFIEDKILETAINKALNSTTYGYAMA
jgi:glutamate formiminotransferase